jgi:hypothetical protein
MKPEYSQFSASKGLLPYFLKLVTSSGTAFMPSFEKIHMLVQTLLQKKNTWTLQYLKLILPYHQEKGLLRLNPKQHHSLSNSRHNNAWKRLGATSVCFLYIRLSTVDA